MYEDEDFHLYFRFFFLFTQNCLFRLFDYLICSNFICCSVIIRFHFFFLCHFLPSFFPYFLCFSLSCRSLPFLFLLLFVTLFISININAEDCLFFHFFSFFTFFSFFFTFWWSSRWSLLTCCNWIISKIWSCL